MPEGSSRRVWFLQIVLAGIVIAVVVTGTYILSDDSARVSDLEDQLAQSHVDLDELQAENQDLEAENKRLKNSLSSLALTPAEYATQAQKILLDFGTRFQALGAEISSSSSPSDFADLVAQAEETIQGAVDDYSALLPPPEAQEGHEQVISALENFSVKLTAVSEAADSGDTAALSAAASDLQQAGSDFQDQLTQASDSLEKAGIDLGGSPIG